MPKPLFRVKRYAHPKYKFVVRAKVGGTWKRRYFASKKEANSYTRQQNSLSLSQVGSGPESLERTIATSARPAASKVDQVQNAPVPERSARLEEAAKSDAASSTEDLPWTGERLVTSCRRPMAYEHLHRYSVACGLAKGKRVLDLACGEGYGSNLLATFASKVIGVDRDAGSIAHAQGKYRRRNLKFLEGTCSAIPCADQSIDLVASFETIEHIAEHKAFLAEIKRVLAPKGLLIISSPDKSEYRKISPTPNPFHELELSHDEFSRLVGTKFKYTVIGKQRLVVGSWIASDNEVSGIGSATSQGWFDRVKIENGVYRGLYSLAICSDAKLPVINLGMFENYKESAETWDLLDRYDTPAELAARMSKLSEENKRKEQQVAAAEGEIEQRSQRLAALQQENEEKTRQVLAFQRDSEERAKHIGILKQENEEKTKQVLHFQRDGEERAKHIGILQRENEEKTKQVLHFQRHAEEQAKHIGILQQENDEKTRQVTHFQGEAREKAQRLGELQRESEQTQRQLAQLRQEDEAKSQQLAQVLAENEARSKRLAVFQRRSELKSQRISQLKQRIQHQLQQIAEFERTALSSSEVIEARWKMLTLQADLLRQSEGNAASKALAIQVQDQLEAATSDRDQLRGMIMALQTDLEQARLELGQLQQSITLKSDQILDLQAENEQATLDIERLETQRQQTDEELRRSSAELDAIRSELRTALGDKEKAVGEVERLKDRSDQFLKLQSENEQAKLDIARLETQRQQTDEELRRSSAELDRMRSELRTVLGDKEKAATEIERLQHRLEQTNDQRKQGASELTDARWEMLTLRADILRRIELAESSREPLIQLQDQLETAASDRDQLRGMLMALQTDLEQERLNITALRGELGASEHRVSQREEHWRGEMAGSGQRIREQQVQLALKEEQLRVVQEKGASLKNRFNATVEQLHALQALLITTRKYLSETARDLLNQRAQMALLRQRVARRLILPFGKSQRKLEELTRES